MLVASSQKLESVAQDRFEDVGEVLVERLTPILLRAVEGKAVAYGESRQAAEVRQDDVPKFVCEFLCFCMKLVLERTGLVAFGESDASVFTLDRASYLGKFVF